MDTQDRSKASVDVSTCTTHADMPGSDTQVKLDELPVAGGGASVDPDAVMVNGQPYPSGWRLTALILGLCMGNFLVALDTTIIATAIPKIVTQFHALDDVGWYGASYLLTVTAFQPPWGKAFRYFSAKWTYTVIIIIFEVGSIICAASKNSPTFTVGRAVAGVGAAGLFQGSLTIIGQTVRLSHRPMFIAIAVSVFGIASCFGPILGGALTDKAGWEWCFWMSVNVPIGVLAAIMAIVYVTSTTTSAAKDLPLLRKLKDMDLPGAALLISSMCCLFLALQVGGNTKPWDSSQVIGLFVGSGLLLLVLCFWQWRLQDLATIPPRMLRQRTMLGGIIFSFTTQMALITHTYYIPFYFQSVQNVSALQSGIRNIPYVAMVTVGAMVSGALITVFRHYMPLMFLGASLYVAGSALIQTFHLGTSTGKWVGYQLLSGGAIGICVQIPVTALQLVLTEEEIPTGNAIMLFFQQLGGAIAVSIAQSIFTTRLRANLQQNADAVIAAGPTNIERIATSPAVYTAIVKAYEQALRTTFILPAAAAGAGLLSCLLMEWKTVGSKKPSVGQAQDTEAGTNGNGPDCKGDSRAGSPSKPDDEKVAGQM